YESSAPLNPTFAIAYAARSARTSGSGTGFGEAKMDKLIERVKAILLTPDTEWPVIAREPDDAGALFTRYVGILALIPALAGFIGGSLIGGYRGIVPGITSAVIGYLLTFVTVFVVALIIDMLAPTFGAQKSFASA